MGPNSNFTGFLTFSQRHRMKSKIISITQQGLRRVTCKRLFEKVAIASLM